MTRLRPLTVAGAAGALAAIGVVVGISTSSAASSSAKGHRPAHAWGYYAAGATGATGPTGPHGPFAGFRGPPGPGRLGGAIHSVEVVPKAAGGFQTVTTDRGTVKAVSAGRLTITEGTKTATYATPTLSLPAAAKVLLDGKPSTLTALAAGDVVVVNQSSTGAASVFATDASFKPAFPGRPGMAWRGGGGPHGGPPPPGPAGHAGP